MRVIVVLLVLLFMSTSLFAQETPTEAPTEALIATEVPTITATPTITPTSTPDLMVYMTLPAAATTGTPEAPRYMAVKLEASVGEIGVTVVGFAIFVLLLITIVIGRKI
jgi:hypothetical protein